MRGHLQLLVNHHVRDFLEHLKTFRGVDVLVAPPSHPEANDVHVLEDERGRVHLHGLERHAPVGDHRAADRELPDQLRGALPTDAVKGELRMRQ